MSRTNKPRCGGWHKDRGPSHHYRGSLTTDINRRGNKWMRQHVRQRLRSSLVQDDDYQKRLPDRKEDRFDRGDYY